MGRCGDASTIFYNPFTRNWCFSLRGWSREYGRLRELSQSADFLGGARSLEDRRPWLREVVGGRTKAGEQLYNFDCVAYEGVLIGLAMVMKGPENDHWAKLGEPKDTYLKFGFARNVMEWKFPKMADEDYTRLEVGAVEPGIPFALVFRSTGGAKLYSFWTGGADGRSGGYLAAGSPGSPTLRDR